MAFEPINRRQVVAALKEYGPMNRKELAEHMGWPVDKVGTTIGTSRHLLPGQIFRAIRYEPVTGMRGRDVAVFAAEAGADAPRKPPNKLKRRGEVQARYRDKNRASINAKHRIRRASRTGLEIVLNPWLQLAPRNMRATMTRV